MIFDISRQGEWLTIGRNRYKIKDIVHYSVDCYSGSSIQITICMVKHYWHHSAQSSAVNRENDADETINALDNIIMGYNNTIKIKEEASEIL